MFAATFVKTRRIYAIFMKTFEEEENNDKFSCPDLDKYIKLNPKNKEVVKTLALILIQFCIILSWILYSAIIGEKDVRSVYQTGRHIETCNFNSNITIFIHSFNALLMLMCTIYAFLGRKIRSDYNESKFIAFAMFTECLIWLCAFFLNGVVNTDDSEKYKSDGDPYLPEKLWSFYSVILVFVAITFIATLYTPKILNIYCKGESKKGFKVVIREC